MIDGDTSSSKELSFRAIGINGQRTRRTSSNERKYVIMRPNEEIM